MRSPSRLLMFIFAITLLIVPAVVLADPLDITETDREINPDEVEVGDAATVTLSVTGNACESTADGADVAFVIDRSGSMHISYSGEDRIGSAVDAATNFVDRMTNPNDRAAVVSFSSSASTDIGLTSIASDKQAVIDALEALRDRANGGTAIGDGITKAIGVFDSNSSNAKAMIVLSDGEDDPADTDPVGKTQNACNAGIQVFAIGLGNNVDPVLPDVPCNGGFYREAPTTADLDAIYQSIADTILGPIGADATITEKVPAGLTASSINNGGVLSGDTITWSLEDVRNNGSVSYQVVANQAGTYTFDSGSGTYENCAGTPDQPFEFPDDNLVVVEPDTDDEDDDSPPEPIPEPATIILLGGGAAMLGAYLRNRREEGEEE